MKKNGKRFKGRFTQKKGHRQVKDRLFRFLFERDRKALLQLYNALNGTSYSEASELQMVTLENAVYVVMKNDLAFVIAGVININYCYNEKLMEQCQVLKEYALFVETSREYIRRGRSAETALNEAVDFCIEKNILAGFLRQYRAEVLGMLLEEFDVKKYERSLREDGREEGREEGIRALVEVCQEFGMSKEDILVRLETRFSMGADSAEQYFEKYQKQL